MTRPLLEIEGLTKSFPTPRGPLRAVSDVGFALRGGAITGLVGESGSGKTTIGRTLLRLIEPDAGRATYDGVDLFTLSPKEMRHYRRRLQIIFQDPATSMNPRLTVGAIISEALDAHGLAKGAARAPRLAALIQSVGLSPDQLRRYPHEFSGGQRQRIGIARALAVEPDFIVADEPVSALDVSVQSQILNLLLDLRRRHSLTLLFISHDLGVVDYICDDIIVLYLGRIVERGTCDQVMRKPRHPYTQALLSASPVPEPNASRDRILLTGDIPSPINPPSGCPFRTRCRHARPECAASIPKLEQVVDGHEVACLRWKEVGASPRGAREAG